MYKQKKQKSKLKRIRQKIQEKRVEMMPKVNIYTIIYSKFLLPSNKTEDFLRESREKREEWENIRKKARWR